MHSSHMSLPWLTMACLPSLAASLLGFGLLNAWCKLLERSGMTAGAFTPQETVVLQTIAVSVYGESPAAA